MAPAVAEGDGIKLLEAFNGRTSATPPSEKVLRCVAVRTLSQSQSQSLPAVSPCRRHHHHPLRASCVESTPSTTALLCALKSGCVLMYVMCVRFCACTRIFTISSAQLLQGQLSRARERQSADVAAASAARASVIEVADDATNRRHLASSVAGALVTVWALQPVWEGTVKRAGDLDLEKKLGTSVFLHHAPSCTVHHGPLGLTVLACVACGQCRSLCFRATCWRHRRPRAAHTILRGAQAP
eukprot:COSAG01_NODE_386_length_17742_cov_25.176654_5_plen_241_part_00